MGIYIKGIDMPEKGTGIVILVKGDGKVSRWFDMTGEIVGTAEGVAEMEEEHE